MENNTAKIQHHGVQCDTQGCDYKVTFTGFDEYEPFVNKPCPQCGANLLTESDYELVQTFHRLATDEEFAKEFQAQNGVPTLPQEIAEMVAKLEDSSVQARVRVEFVDGMPKMTSDDPAVQELIDAIDEYIKSEAEMVQHLDSLEENN